MSLLIDVDEVTAVLLADGWHQVNDYSLHLDAYEFAEGNKYAEEGYLCHSGGQGGVCSTGFEFYEADGSVVAGPLTAILAVRRNGRDW